MSRPWSDHEIVISHPPLRRPYSSDLGNDFVLKNTTFRAPAISQNVTKCCACHEKWQSNFTKYCACHAKWISWLMRVSYETSFPMRRASNVNLQPQQILRLPRKMNPMMNPRHTWNVIYNARSMHSQPPTSPNTAPATKSVSSRLQRKLRELLPPIERRFDDNPTIIRRQSDQKIASRTRRFGDLTRPTLNTILYWKIQHFALRLSPKMSPNAAPATKNALYSSLLYSLLASILSWHLFSLGIYSLYASILPRHLFSLGIYSL